MSTTTPTERPRPLGRDDEPYRWISETSVARGSSTAAARRQPKRPGYLGYCPGDAPPPPPAEAPVPVSFPVLALAWGLTFVGAAVHGTIGMGIALVSVPILALVDPALVPVPQMFLALVLNSALFWRERGALDTDGLGWVIAGRVPGAVLGAWLVAVLGARPLSITVAATILAAVAILASGVTITRNRTTGFLAGVGSGVGNHVAGMGGPALALDLPPLPRAGAAQHLVGGVRRGQRDQPGGPGGRPPDRARRPDPGGAAAPGHAARAVVEPVPHAPRRGEERLRAAILGVSALAAIGLWSRACWRGETVGRGGPAAVGGNHGAGTLLERQCPLLEVRHWGS